jgi:hypothetical protein
LHDEEQPMSGGEVGEPVAGMPTDFSANGVA